MCILLKNEISSGTKKFFTTANNVRKRRSRKNYMEIAVRNASEWANKMRENEGKLVFRNGITKEMTFQKCGTCMFPHFAISMMNSEESARSFFILPISSSCLWSNFRCKIFHSFAFLVSQKWRNTYISKRSSKSKSIDSIIG